MLSAGQFFIGVRNMYIFFWLLALTAVTAGFNKQSGAQNSSENLDMGRSGSMLMLGSFVVAVLLQVGSGALGFSTKLNFIVAIVFAILCVFLNIYINATRAKRIKEEHDSILMICDVLGRRFAPSAEDVDFSNLPFEIEKQRGKIRKVTVHPESVQLIKDELISDMVISMNQSFPEFEWMGDGDASRREIVLQGNPRPPRLALWPGSDLRPIGYIPVGMSGRGEVSWNMGAPSDLGVSLFVDPETGERAETVEYARAPQNITSGGTGGGKSVWQRQRIKILAR